MEDDPIARFHSLKPSSYPILQQFLIEQLDRPGATKELQLTLVMRETATIDGRATELAFHGVRELRVDWPPWSVVRATAESALSDLQAANSAGIQSWLSTAAAGSRQAFAASFESSIGRILYAGANSSVEGSSAIGVPEANPASPLGYYLITGYVAP
ncbi:MAG: hypothetical protein JO198_06630 [Candidatus Dormibacteraeota bacterium]|nr:hypothetical protein [Candidatus Dormibacteraeota bacterium]